MLIYERTLAREIAYTLPMFRDFTKAHGGPRFNFRCPICGDSKKDKFKTRGWIYEHKGKMRMGCFNCNANMTLYDYIKEYRDDMYRDYIKERYKNEDTPEYEREVIVEEVPVLKAVSTLPYSENCGELHESHPVRKWLFNRAIPAPLHKRFFFTTDWRKLANHIKPETYGYEDKEYRLVIPIYNKDKTISCIQGRALSDVDKSQRYLTIKPHDDSNKVYGLERVKDTGNVFFLEGPIDSIFIVNGIAIVGGQMNLGDAPYPERRVWVLDNEPRAVDTVRRIEKLVEAGEKIVLWDECPWISKDPNDMIKNEGATIRQLNDYLNQNIIKGLSAKRRLSRWRRC